MNSKRLFTTALIAFVSWLPSALAQYESRVGVYARVEDGCYGERREVYVTDFRKVSVDYGSAVYQGYADVPHRCSYRDGFVRAQVTIRVSLNTDYVDYYGFLVEPLHRNAYASCEGSSSWRRYTNCHVELARAPAPRPRPPRPPRPPEPPPYYPPDNPPYNPPQPPPYNPPQPPPRPRPPTPRPPVPPPPSQGSPLVVNTEVDVGCRGRVAPVTVTNLSLVSDDGRYLTFSGYTRVNHKCGNTRNIGATVNVTIHRSDARVNQSGVLLSPAVNASVNCVGQSDFAGGSTMCRVTSQN